jgi:3-dehydroquinate dehydratase-2
MTKVVYLLNGPNLDLLGEREPAIYGHHTLTDIEDRCRSLAEHNGMELICHQTNREYEMIDWLHEARRCDGIILNPAAFTYHSVPILDALKMCECPIVEVHISNIHRREAEWRSKSIMTVAATGIVSGFGIKGYTMALHYLIETFAEGA